MYEASSATLKRMTVVSTSAPISPSRLRIAITSPDILARIRHVFASKNLDVEIVRMPYVEVAVRPAASPGSADRSAVGNALHLLVGPASQAGATASSRAEYRLNVVEVGAGPKAEHHDPAGRRHPESVPDPDTDSPVVNLSQRQHEVMALVSRGARNAEIASRLHVSEKTVKNHINRIFRSLGAGSRVEAVLIWQRLQQDGATGRSAPTPPPVLVGGRHPLHGGNL